MALRRANPALLLTADSFVDLPSAIDLTMNEVHARSLRLHGSALRRRSFQSNDSALIASLTELRDVAAGLNDKRRMLETRGTDAEPLGWTEHAQVTFRHAGDATPAVSEF